MKPTNKDDIRNEGALRTALLTSLYTKRMEKYGDITPESFSPAWTMRDIVYFGGEFHEADLIKDFPSDHGRGGYFMRISLHGKAVWEGREASSLDFEGLPE